MSISGTGVAGHPGDDRAGVRPHPERLSMAPRNPLLLLVAAVIGLCAGIAGFTLGSAPHGSAAIAPAELSALDTSFEIPPALTRAGFAMAAVESSRRKLRAPQRPPAQSLILTGRTMADAPARLEIRLRPAPDLPPEAGRTNLPFPARGPPAWNLA
jgi:hypothetical protein